MIKRRVTIAICTFDRFNVLGMCLNSIKEFIGEYSTRTDVLVIDNKGQSEVIELVNAFNSTLKIKYIHCDEVGLSHARNEAALNANGDYIFYLDDDAKLLSRTLREVFIMIDEYDFDIFGGSYIPYYIGEKPSWIPSNFGASKYTQKSVGLTDHSLSGSLFIMKIALINHLQFNPQYGMSGKKMGYGEETYFQQKAMEMGFTVGFNPDLRVEHLVAKYKHEISWQLASYFHHGLYSDFNVKSAGFKPIRILKDIFFFIPAGFFFAIKNFMLKKEYYYQNFIVDSLANIFILIGRMRSLFL
jgi:GT2 family glycosyltransferase